jgi:eukaryotic-like serine/threonine-protein kinase
VALTAGTRLGPYEINALIGKGGMGKVYRATDTKLKRQVALKILPSELAANPDRIARFQREAEVLALLNHSNIAQIHGLEDGDGVQALVMEFVEGPTLADRIAQGPIPLNDALPIARQVAEALEAAHRRRLGRGFRTGRGERRTSEAADAKDSSPNTVDQDRKWLETH